MKKNRIVREILNTSASTTFFAVLASFIVGGVLIAIANQDVQAAIGYFFNKPGDTFAALWNAVSGAYVAMFRGAIYNYNAHDFANGISPITDTLAFATPITLAGLGLAVAFRSGLFNIGANGQIIFGAMLSGWVAIYVHAPIYVLFPLAVLAGLIGGAIWGGLVGLLKATTGANEVIVTIMFNYIAVYLLGYLLKTPVLKAPESINPVSLPVQNDAKFPLLFGSDYRLHAGFFVMLAAVAFVWWLLNRSTIGYQFRALGHNPDAAKVAGINIGMTYILVMAISGALSGLAGASQILGTERVLTTGVAASYGIDAITVALLGRSKPLGVLAAGILFGALRAGAVTMQANQNVPSEIVLVVQSLIVLFIAAPPLVRAMFRLPKAVKA
jgi:simple sugar transport system permease protein